MKLMFASDIHGSGYYCEKMKKAYDRQGAEKLILLGDLLYHGPRNDLPKEYDPKKVITILNSMKNEILCVRGNCDAEVDQMVLEFPILADYMTMFLEDKMVFVTHGHLYHKENLPPLKRGDILIHGHTHVALIEKELDYTVINPGSIAIPKADKPSSYMIYENGVFQILDLETDQLLGEKELFLLSLE